MLNFSLLPPIHHDNHRAITTCWSSFKNNLNNTVCLEEYAGINNPHVLEEKFNFSPPPFAPPINTPLNQLKTRSIPTLQITFTNSFAIRIERKKLYHNTLNPRTKHNITDYKRNLKKNSKTQTWQNKLESLNARDNSLWHCQKLFRKNRPNIPSLSTSSGVANSDDQKANILAITLKDNFAENKRPGNGSHPIDKEITKTLENFFSSPPTLPLTPTDPTEICEYIRRLKNNKAPGSDQITNKMVKNFNTKTLLILTYLINKILFLRHFPNNWKNAIVFPIKKPDKNAHNPSSYRPISLLSVLSKITENLSTYHPLLGLTEKITAGFQRGRSTGAVFLDIQKAFDRVWVSGLVYKLITNNFPPALTHIINSYLVNRTFQVRVNDSLTNTFNINYGVPQGSLLGPLLFNIYINDMPTHPQTSTNIYADDTVTLATYKNHNTITLALNNHLYLLQNFFDTWKIKINVDKTVAVLFTRRKTQPTPPTLYSTQLQWSQSTKYLGLILDKKLTWKQHLTHKRDKFRKALRALYPLIGWNSELNMYNKILLYTAVLRPILTYGSPVWGYAADSNIKIIEVAQNSIIRNIVKADRYTKNSYIYKDIKTVPVTTPPCHFQPTNQDSLTNQGPPTSGHIYKIRYGMEERFAFHFPSDDQRPLTSTYSVYTRRVFGDIEHRTQAFRSGV
ncbi:probable RNA-directed DNA polymerase from transposon X-element [Trichonephila clavipes]|uniref:Probable RNA-directed DNA polymerase from transposon X-element n=1 Tax=Trichonephila clavipes TaxID=2585209 RepID=A0A8X6SL66_TRICX|nr:probable RNA-directed DNA polymerase from transposon X-element [Trichonephila clavipes]